MAKTKLDHYLQLANHAALWAGPTHAKPTAALRPFMERVPRAALIDRQFWLGAVLDEIRQRAQTDLDASAMQRLEKMMNLITERPPAGYPAHARRARSAEWLRGERHGARAAAESVLKYGKSFAALALRDLQANLRSGKDIEDFDRGYTSAYAVTLKASPAEIQELGRPLTAAELDRDIQEALGRKRGRG